jgi:hypothetical protein
VIFASNPDVPFGAAGTVAMAVVLARRSVPTQLAAERNSACSSAEAGGLPCLLQLPAPQHHNGDGCLRARRVFLGQSGNSRTRSPSPPGGPM